MASHTGESSIPSERSGRRGKLRQHRVRCDLNRHERHACTRADQGIKVVLAAQQHALSVWILIPQRWLEAEVASELSQQPRIGRSTVDEHNSRVASMPAFKPDFSAAQASGGGLRGAPQACRRKAAGGDAARCSCKGARPW